MDVGQQIGNIVFKLEIYGEGVPHVDWLPGVNVGSVLTTRTASRSRASSTERTTLTSPT